jgi:7-carboxy-7-deazaguanine synthase
MYKLVEIFESLQGEGRNTGRPCVFVRFAGCNLSCPWCDTDVAPRFELSLDELVVEATSFKAKSVILTGGEPTIQAGMPALVAALKKAGLWIAVETNGLLAPDWLGQVDYVACSPKAEVAVRYRSDAALRRCDEVRIVASSPDVVPFAREIRARIAATDYYVSPCERDGQIDFATAKAALSQLDGWSLSVQLHKILGFR